MAVASDAAAVPVSSRAAAAAVARTGRSRNLAGLEWTVMVGTFRRGTGNLTLMTRRWADKAARCPVWPAGERLQEARAYPRPAPHPLRISQPPDRESGRSRPAAIPWNP
ncbi:hypothetical protein GCM10023223_33880 [Stackebrandtia albiflava]